jgi:hypothetical protein
VQDATGGSPDDIRAFFAKGMLMNVMASISASDVDEPWAQILSDCAD